MHTQVAQLGHICAVAVSHFERHGFDSVTLDHLAHEMGIATPSLRRYFPDTAALYLQAFREAARVETTFLRAGFEAETAESRPGSLYCQLLASRFSDSPYLRFLLRAAYAPPATLRVGISARFSVFLDDVATEFRSRLLHSREGGGEGHDTAVLEMVYLDVVDGLFSSLIDGGEARFDSRWEALEEMFSRAFESTLRRRRAPLPAIASVTEAEPHIYSRKQS